MIDTVKKEINRRTTISSTTVHGLPAVLFSLPFITVGIFIILNSFELIELKNFQSNISRNLAAAFGGLFLLPGLLLFVHGIQSWIKQKKFNEFKKEGRNESWEVDFSWNKRVVSSRERAVLIKQFFSAIGFAVILLPMAWFFFFTYEKGTVFLKVIIGIFMIVVLWIWVDWIYQLLKYLKYGESKLNLNSFPFYLGNTMNAVLETSKYIQGLNQIEIILRCVQENYEMRGHGKNRRSEIISYQIYAETQLIDNASMYQAGALRLPMTIDLPQEKIYETCLSCRPARYWELEVKAKTPGIDYQTNFIVPVYAKVL